MVTKILAMTLGISCLSIATLATAQPAPARPLITDPVYTKADQLVDVGGGRRLNLHCRGAGSPAVIFDSGLSDSTIAWALVQPAISKTNATCSYDRAGMGFSDAATRPGTAANDVDDIHKALQGAHIKPPYVVVGHSAGGMAVRVFADRYRDEVVGMVIVDGSHEDQSSRFKAIAKPGVQAHWDDDRKDTTCMDAVKAGHGKIPRDSPAYKKCVGEPDARFSQAINNANLEYSAKLKYQAAFASESESFDGASADQTRATRRDFGDMPIIVLTHAPYPRSKTLTQQEQDQRTATWEQMHNEVAAMSTHGVNEIVPRAGHLINYDRPEIVIDAIHQALAVAAEQSIPPAPTATK
ncbi:alpha/beta fold hydrolase [Rhodanobacter sp. Col0626]|uniref:alpha/beta fold hydrolase n=1 Tax=Rhodanobacter sp. Col0626 TaxID=3415679 RepID=UPI003CF443E6